MRRAAIHQLKDRIFIHPWQVTDMGLGIASEPYAALPLEGDPAHLGGAAGDNKGFDPLPDLKMAVEANIAAADLGNVIRKALQLSHEQSNL